MMTWFNNSSLTCWADLLRYMTHGIWFPRLFLFPLKCAQLAYRWERQRHSKVVCSPMAISAPSIRAIFAICVMPGIWANSCWWLWLVMKAKPAIPSTNRSGLRHSACLALLMPCWCFRPMNWIRPSLHSNQRVGAGNEYKNNQDSTTRSAAGKVAPSNSMQERFITPLQICSVAQSAIYDGNVAPSSKRLAAPRHWASALEAIAPGQTLAWSLGDTIVDQYAPVRPSAWVPKPPSWWCGNLNVETS